VPSRVEVLVEMAAEVRLRDEVEASSAFSRARDCSRRALALSLFCSWRLLDNG
jgi:hypothetical protein